MKPIGAGIPMPRPAMRARVELWIWRHGVWLPVLALVTAALVALVWSAVLLQQQNEPAATAVRAAPSAADANEGPEVDFARLTEFRKTLAPIEDSTALVRRLVELTRPQLAWQRADFGYHNEQGIGVQRLQITVPVVGEYAEMRRVIARSLVEIPNLALDEVQLRRVQPDRSVLEARLRFSLWFALRPNEGRP